MGSLTGLLYACLALFLGGWYLGKWSGNFSLLLLILTLVTFAYWLAERFHFAPRRRLAAAALEERDAARRDELARQGIVKVDATLASARSTSSTVQLCWGRSPSPAARPACRSPASSASSPERAAARPASTAG